MLIVEDSATAREMLVHILSSDREVEVVGVAKNGEEALVATAELRPDVITMDIHMPKLDGFETTRRIMETNPVPIVIVSASVKPDDVEKAFRVMDAGALTILEKPPGPSDANYSVMAAKLIRTVKVMSEVRVVKRWGRGKTELQKTTQPVAGVAARRQPIELIAIGASTGGPPVLHTILAGLDKNCGVPILIVQHISAGFVQGLVDWLGRITAVPVHLAAHGQQMLPGHVYVAPDDRHMGVDKVGRILIVDAPPENGLRPAVSYLFRSVATVFGGRALGVLLTGMGRDGATELRLMRDRGAVTIAQDQESSIVFGMPGEAVKIDAASYVLPPLRIVATLNALLSASQELSR